MYPVKCDVVCILWKITPQTSGADIHFEVLYTQHCIITSSTHLPVLQINTSQISLLHNTGEKIMCLLYKPILKYEIISWFENRP